MNARVHTGVVAVALAVACGGAPGPAPDDVRTAGYYTGTITPDNVNPPEPPYVEMIVTQSGSSVALEGSLGLSLVQILANFEARGTIDEDGRFTATSGGIGEVYAEAIPHPERCGAASTTSLRIRFNGLTAEWSEDAETENCGRVRYVGELDERTYNPPGRI